MNVTRTAGTVRSIVGIIALTRHSAPLNSTIHCPRAPSASAVVTPPPSAASVHSLGGTGGVPTVTASGSYRVRNLTARSPSLVNDHVARLLRPPVTGMLTLCDPVPLRVSSVALIFQKILRDLTFN